MILIFYFSAQTAEESTGQSDSVSYMIGSIIYKDFNTWPDLRKAEFADSLSSFVRKAAHMTEYGILAALWYNAIGTVWIAFVITVAYAATDEFHQLFVEGRTGKVGDVLIDAGGALIACAIILIVRHLIKRNLPKGER